MKSFNVEIMNSYKISINQLASFPKKTQNGKIAIIRQQLKPNTVVVTKYKQAKKIVATALVSNGNKGIIVKGIEDFKKSIATTKTQVQNKVGSIAALEKFLKKKLPHIFLENAFEIMTPKRKNKLVMSDVEIVVSPDLIIKTIIDGQAYFGAIKIHISQGGVFDREDAKYVTTCLFQYMNNHYGDLGTIWSELCLCVDVFGDNIKYAPANTDNTIDKINVLCEEIKQLWESAAA
jgi:hypothetical protein